MTDYESLLQVVKDRDKLKQKFVIELTADELETLNLVNWYIYEKLCKRLDKTKDIIEKSSIELFLESYEGAVMKINEM
jgi:hypothetical protein